MCLLLAAFAACDVSDRLLALAKEPEPLPPGTAPANRQTAFAHGVYLGDAETTPERVAAAISDFAALTGHSPALVKSFHNLGADLSEAGWAGRVLREVDRVGAANLVALDLSFPGSPEKQLLAAIAEGRADQAIARAARGVAAISRTVLVQPGWEMNGNWGYPWQGVENGGDAAAARAFVAAYRHIVDIFRREGASNVRWVFSPNTGNPVALGSGPGHWNWYGNYYPGDDYVDFIGVHGFNGPSVWGGPWRSFGRLMDSREMDHFLSDAAMRYGKPILIAEFASQEPAGGGSGKADWIAEAYRQMLDRPEIAGAVWFNQRKESDWRIDSSSGALAAYRAAMTQVSASSMNVELAATLPLPTNLSVRATAPAANRRVQP
jgi:endoglucanase